MAMLATPLSSVDAYVDFFSRQQIPVLRQSLRQLQALQARQEELNAKRLAYALFGDPLLILRLFTTLMAEYGKSLNHDITTIDRAIMVMGVAPFFKAFADVATLEETLAGQPRAQLGALHVIGRSRKAAHYARDWAILRHDLDVEEITVAALLHASTEIICWTFAPTLALEVQRLQTEQPELRTADAQRMVFGTTARDIQAQLVRTWRMPELLVGLIDGNVSNSRVQNVRLACNFTRHVARGWDNAALPDDLTGIERLTHLSREALLTRLDAPPADRERLLALSAPPPAPGDLAG